MMALKPYLTDYLGRKRVRPGRDIVSTTAGRTTRVLPRLVQGAEQSAVSDPRLCNPCLTFQRTS